jgi:hypothetical protein
MPRSHRIQLKKLNQVEEKLGVFVSDVSLYLLFDTSLKRTGCNCYSLDAVDLLDDFTVLV